MDVVHITYMQARHECTVNKNKSLNKYKFNWVSNSRNYAFYNLMTFIRDSIVLHTSYGPNTNEMFFVMVAGDSGSPMEHLWVFLREF